MTEHPILLDASLTRRGFLNVAAATAGLGWVSRVHPLRAEAEVNSSGTGETDHFWYRLQKPGPYVDTQRDNRAFGFTDDAIFLSKDNGHTWAHKLAFPNARHVTFSCLLKNGNILFATRTQLYLSIDDLRTIEPIAVQDADGADVTPHEPKNPEYPGWYFHPLDGIHTWDINGCEMLVWGNYGNVRGGATPSNIYYSLDSGRTVKIAYAFGQHPHYQDNGTTGGGAPGAVLGDPDNSLFCRHVHCAMYNPAEDAFYACTGDRDRGEKHECHWLKGVYDAKKDRWEWRVLVSTESNTRYKSGGINFVDGKLYWVADANGIEPHDRGFFCCDPADLTEPDRHTRVYDAQYESANLIIQDGVMLAAYYAPASPYATGFIISLDAGRTWILYDLTELGPHSPVRFDKMNSEGWFRVDLRTGWIDRDTVLFIKPKS